MSIGWTGSLADSISFAVCQPDQNSVAATPPALCTICSWRATRSGDRLPIAGGTSVEDPEAEDRDERNRRTIATGQVQRTLDPLTGGGGDPFVEHLGGGVVNSKSLVHHGTDEVELVVHPLPASLEIAAHAALEPLGGLAPAVWNDDLIHAEAQSGNLGISQHLAGGADAASVGSDEVSLPPALELTEGPRGEAAWLHVENHRSSARGSSCSAKNPLNVVRIASGLARTNSFSVISFPLLVARPETVTARMEIPSSARSSARRSLRCSTPG